MPVLNYMISSVLTTICTEHLITNISNQMSLNNSQACQVSHKCVYKYHQTKCSIIRPKCINVIFKKPDQATLICHLLSGIGIC